MIEVNFKKTNGEIIKVEVEEGTTLMEAAKFYASLDEVPGDCGGCCACGTCHIHIDDRWLAKVGTADYNSPETDLLEYTKSYDRMKSRLSCQIELKQKHNGILVNLLDDELL